MSNDTQNSNNHDKATKETEIKKLKETINKILSEHMEKSRHKNRFHSASNSDKPTYISITTASSLEDFNPKNKKLLFDGVYELLQKFDLKAELFTPTITYLKALEEQKPKPNNRPYKKLLGRIEQDPSSFKLSEVFKTASSDDKYRMINAIFSELGLVNEKISFSLRMSFWILINCIDEMNGNEGEILKD